MDTKIPKTGQIRRFVAIVASFVTLVSGLSLTATPAMALSAAPKATVTAGLKSIALSWTAVAGATGYTVKHSATSTIPATAATTTVALSSSILSYTVTGLADNTKHYAKVAANVNGVDQTYSSVVSAVTATVPVAVTGLKAAAGLKSLALSWTASKAVGTPITGYKVDYSTNATLSSGVTTVETTNLTTTLTGLSDNTTYYVRVRATNAVGNGINSAIVSAKTASVSTAPATMTATVGAGTAKFAWTAPASNGGSLVTGYRFEYDTTNSFSNPTVITLGSVLTYTVTGLLPSTTYYGRVAAINAVGTSAYSATASTLTYAVPGVPTSLAGTANALQTVNLSWVAPTSTGGSAITGYVVRYSKDNTFSTGVLTASGTTLTAKIIALDSSSTYYFQVAAKTAAGTGAYTNAIAINTWTTPNVPTGLATVTGNKTFTATWVAPVNKGGTGAVVTGYRAQYSTDATFATNVVTVDLSGTTVKLAPTGLLNNTTYYVRVAAKNTVGFGSYNSNVTVKTFDAPAAPQNITGVSGLSAITVNWTAPASNGGSPVTGYLVQYSTNSDMSGAVTSAKLAATVNTLAISKLKPTTNYYVSVSAISLVGNGAYSTPITVATVAAPPAPSITSMTGGYGSVTINWANQGTSTNPITGYRVEYSTTDTFTAPVSVAISNPATLTATVKSLRPGVTYYARVFAKSIAGESAASSVANASTSNGADVPTAFSGTSVFTDGLGAVLNLSWTAPEFTNNLAITGYSVQTATDANFTAGVKTIATGSTATTYNASGFAPNTTYYVRVAAVTAAGIGAYTSTLNFTTVDAAIAPTALAAVSAVKALNATWTPVNGISSYTVQIATANTFLPAVTTTFTTTDASYNFTGLLDGKTYYIRVASNNTLGTGAYSTALTKGTLALAATPKGLTATDNGNGSFNASWLTVAPTATAPVAGYRVQYSTSSTFASNVTTLDTASLTAALPASGTYYVRVATLNAVGAGAYSTAVTVTATDVPSAPKNVVATLNDARNIDLVWDAPASNGGKEITGYTVTVNGGEGTVTVTGTSATVTGLTAGATYTFTVKATNANGDSIASELSNSIMTATVPSAPQNVAATVSSTSSINLAWDASADNGGSIVTGYEVTVSPNAGVVVVDGLTASVTGLTAGVSYEFTVKAINSVGSSNGSTASKLVATVPSSVTNVSPEMGSDLKSINVAWSASDANGSAITGYKVVWLEEGSTVQSMDVDANTTSATITGLTTGSSYSVNVIAKNAIGETSVNLSTSPSVSLVAAPSAPVINSATSGNGTLSLDWNPVASNGSIVTSYVVEYSTSSDFSNSTTVSLNNSGVMASEPATTVDGLTAGATYYVRVKAVNSVGSSSYSSAQNVTIPSISSSVTGLSVSNDGLTATATWNTPASNGGSTITGYRVSYTSNGNTTVVDTQNLSLSFVLEEGASYSLSVVAINAIGMSEASVTTLVAPTVATAPTNVNVTVTSPTSVSLSWNAPVSNGGSYVTGFEVTLSSSAATDNSTIVMGSKSATITGLESGLDYTFTVKAINAVGKSAGTNAYALVALAPSAPSAPIMNLDTETSLSVIWSAPASNGGSPITSYVVAYSTNSDMSGATEVSTTEKSMILNGLTAGTVYYVAVKAKNIAGGSSYSAVSSHTPGVAPDAVSMVWVGLDGVNGATVTWDAPADNGRAITGYRVEYSIDSTFSTNVYVIDVTSTTASIAGLTSGSTYYVRVTAINELGTSAHSGSTSIVMPTAPDAPSLVEVTTTSNTSVSLSWSKPLQNGNSEITGYEVTVTDDTNTPSVPASNAVVTVTGTTATVTGLNEGSAYTFHVQATNAVGTGSEATGSKLMQQWALTDSPFNQLWTTTSYYMGQTCESEASLDPTLTTGVSVGLNYSDCWYIASPTSATNVTYYGRIRSSINGIYSDWSPIASGITNHADVTNVVASTTDGMDVNLSWNAPADDGSARGIESYEIKVYNETDPSQNFTDFAWNTSTVITGLSTSSVYRFEVRTLNVEYMFGSLQFIYSPNPVSSNLITLPAVASAPQNVVATVASNSSVTLAWDAPASDGLSAVTGYEVITEPSASVAVSGTSATVTGLTAGTTYTFTVKAINSVGKSAGASVSKLVATAPESVSTPNVAIATSTSITASWSAPVENGSAITGYRVQYSSDASFGTGVQTIDVATVEAAINGLTSGTTYYVRVKAINAIGESNWSNAAVVALSPASPSNVSATFVSTSSVNLSWDNTLGATSYEVTVTDNNGNNYSTPVVTMNSNSATITDLTGGGSYTFSVKSVNSSGMSPASSTKILMNSWSVSYLSAYASQSGDIYMYAYFANEIGGLTPNEVCEYQYSSDPSFETDVTTGTDCSYIYEPGLTPNTTYNLRIRSLQSGAYSAWSPVATVTSPHGAPTGVTVTRISDSSALISWEAPVGGTANAVDGYGVSYYSELDHVYGTMYGNNSNIINGTSTVISDLKPGNTYYFSVGAVSITTDSKGNASYKWGIDSPMTAGYLSSEAPAPITNVVATPSADGNSFSLSWVDGADNGHAITSHTVEYSTDSSFATGVTTVENATSGMTITPNAGGAYYVRVNASNSSGAGAWSNLQDIYGGSTTVGTGVPVRMTLLSASSLADTTGYYEWDALNGNGSSVNKLAIQISTEPTFTNGVIVDNWFAATDNRSATNYGSSSFVVGTTYYVRFKAANTNGYGSWSSAISYVQGAPSLVRNMAVTLNNNGIDVTPTWLAPSYPSNRAVTSYTLEYSTSAIFNNNVTTINNATSGTTITGLTPGSSYYFRVLANNSAGAGNWSTSSGLQSGGVTVGQPAIIMQPTVAHNSTGDAQVVTWVAPENNGNAITSYTVQYSTSSSFTGGVQNTTVAGSATNATISYPQLQPGATYYYRVMATNANGDSVWSDSSSPLTFGVGATQPAPVLGLKSNGYQVSAGWSRVINSLGSLNAVELQWSTSSNFSTVAGSATNSTASFTIPFYSNFGGYYFRSRANQVSGWGEWSNPSYIVVGAPADPSLSVQTSGMSVILNASTNGPSPATSYVVVWQDMYNGNTGSLTMGQSGTIFGIMNHPYTFYVDYSSNLYGNNTNHSGTYYIAGAATDTPAAPSATIGSEGNSLNVTWSTPINNTWAYNNCDWDGYCYDYGSNIIGFNVDYSTSATFDTYSTVSTGAVNSTSITGLANGTYYTRVTAITQNPYSGGWSYSQASSASNGVLTGAPAQMAAPTVTISDAGTGFVPTWTAPADNGNAITSYTLEYSTSSTFASSVTTVTDAISGTAINGIGSSGTTFYARVKAINSNGKSVVSAASTGIKIGTPSVVRTPALGATTTTSQVVSWTAPLTGTSTDYMVQYSTNNTTWTTFAHTASTALTQTVTGLTANTIYYFRVAPVNANGTGAYTSAGSKATVAAAPTALVRILNSEATASSNSAILSWTAPAGNGITDYTVQFATYAGGACTTYTTFADGVSTATTATVTGLAALGTYCYKVFAVTSGGTGAASNILTNIFQPLTTPTGLGVNGSAAATSVALKWTAPSGTPTDYAIQYSTDGGVTWTTWAHTAKATTGNTVTGLVSGTAYKFRVAAKTANGIGSWSTIISVTTP